MQRENIQINRDQAVTKTIGVLGLGSAGMRHAKNLLAMGHRVFGFDPLDRPFDVFNGIECHTFRKVMESDAIIIASPTPLHLEHIQETEGKPTFVEKPLAHVLPMHIEHVVGVGCMLRFHSCVKKAKEWLDAGLIGTPIWARFTVSQLNKKYKDHVALNWLSHECDLALYLLGPGALDTASGNDHIMDMTVLHEDGVRCSIHGDYLTNPERRDFIIVGNDGIIEVDLVNRTAKLSSDGKDTKFVVGDDSWDMNYQEEMTHFIKAIDGEKSTLLASGQDGLNTLSMILDAIRVASHES